MNAQPMESEATQERLCSEFGELLGLDIPVSVDVLNAALASESYARSLLSSRRTPQMLKMLLASPPQRAVRKAEFGTLELLQRGSRALLAWSKTGFSTTDPVERQQRTDACLACPDRRAAAGHPLHASRSDLGVCGLCGCPLSRKVAMTSETCPGQLAGEPSRNRWGQTIAVSPLQA
ncbi:hypothetical protein ACM7T0_17235 [Pseudomonas aeruginosa]